jgi:hypothetical protein
MNNLLKNNDFTYGGAAVAAANNTDDNSSRFDMAGYDGVLFVTTITDSAATGVATLTVEANTADSDSGMAAISGAVATKTCTVNDDINGKLLIVDVYRPLKRYVQGVRTSGTANIAFGEVLAIRYKGRKLPVTQGTTVAASTQVVGS